MWVSSLDSKLHSRKLRESIKNRVSSWEPIFENHESRRFKSLEKTVWNNCWKQNKASTHSLPYWQHALNVFSTKLKEGLNVADIYIKNILSHLCMKQSCNIWTSIVCRSKGIFFSFPASIKHSIQLTTGMKTNWFPHAACSVIIPSKSTMYNTLPRETNSHYTSPYAELPDRKDLRKPLGVKFLEKLRCFVNVGLLHDNSFYQLSSWCKFASVKKKNKKKNTTQVSGDMTSGEMTLGRLDRLPSKARNFSGWPISMINSVDKTKLCKEESIE